MLKSSLKAVMIFGIAAVVSTQASLVNVNIESYSDGYYSILNGVGASFAQSFVGQTVSGTDLIGNATAPLTLNTTGNNLWVQNWTGSNSILSQPGNQAPLAILLDSDANQLSWRMGYANNPGMQLTLNFYNNNGQVVETQEVSLLSGYNDYSIATSSAFKGLAIFNNNDAAGLRFQNFSYNTVPVATPEPSTLALFGFGLFSLIGLRLRRK